MRYSRAISLLLAGLIALGALWVHQVQLPPLFSNSVSQPTKLALGDDALLSLPGTRKIVSANLGRKVRLTHQACEFTMTLDRVYADAQHIVIGYTLRGPGNRPFSPGLGW